MRAMDVLNGLLLVDKPQGWTSHDVVAFIRKRFGVRKVGHGGTLDPIATGLLVILAGGATRWAQSLLGWDKRYAVVVTLGQGTDTGDADGRIQRTAPVPPVTEAQVQDVLVGFLGAQWQEPPAMSAVKVRGRPLYYWTRRGVAVERRPRMITVHAMTLTRLVPPPDAAAVGSPRPLAGQPSAGASGGGMALPQLELLIHCSKGTYIRTLAEAIGSRLGTEAHVSALRRLSVGPLTIEDAVSCGWLAQASPDEVRAKLRPWPETTLCSTAAPVRYCNASGRAPTP